MRRRHPTLVRRNSSDAPSSYRLKKTNYCHGLLGEEWADNENAGTSAEAQAFKRACSCFGLGRYLYDLGGNWVDLDERKQPLSRPRLPDWALPKRKTDALTCRNGHTHAGTNGHTQHN